MTADLLILVLLPALLAARARLRIALRRAPGSARPGRWLAAAAARPSRPGAGVFARGPLSAAADWFMLDALSAYHLAS